MVVKDHKAGRREFVPAMQVLLNRVKHGFWLISARNPYRKRIAAGDNGLFYVASKMGRVIAGTCQITSGVQPATAGIKSVIEGYPSNLLTHYFEIKGVIWANPIEAGKVVPNMSFVKNRERWAAYLQGTLHPILREDYELVLRYQSQQSAAT